MDDPDMRVQAGRVDKYSLDLGNSNFKNGRQPRTWKEAVKIAGWIHIDEIRSLLELHYDDVHYAKWKREDGKASSRKSEYTVLNKVARAYRSKLCQRLVLPMSVKDILKRPTDEDAWGKLEQVRKAVAWEVEGEEPVYLASQEEADRLAVAIQSCANTRFFDEVGLGSKLPPGTRIVVDGARTKEDVVKYVRGATGLTICALMRPLDLPGTFA